MKSKLFRAACLIALCLSAVVLSACADAQAPAQPSDTPVPSAQISPEAEATQESAPTPALPDIDIDSWEFIVANSYNSIGEYMPDYGGLEGQGVDSRIAQTVMTMLQDARNAGLSAYVAVGYRNYEYLLNHYTNKILQYGSAADAAAVYCGPGVNEHQTGLAIDITDNINYRSTFDDYTAEGICDTELYQWMLEHCHEYGFILRYPEGKEEYYGTACCPGHFRYVGVEAATYIMENDLCLEEFLLMYDPDSVFVPEN